MPVPQALPCTVTCASSAATVEPGMAVPAQSDCSGTTPPTLPPVTGLAAQLPETAMRTKGTFAPAARASFAIG